ARRARRARSDADGRRLGTRPGRGIQPQVKAAAIARLGAALLLALAALTPAAAGDQDIIARGAEIYLHGHLADGGLLEGPREEGLPPAAGSAAACVNCHRHSGLGSTEGRTRIPPITGHYLMPPRGRGDKAELRFVDNMRLSRTQTYTDETIARAIREGTDSDGRAMSALMPRYAIGDADMAALIAYLKSLDRSDLPGVTGTVLHFATVVTPDADPVRREATLAVLDQYVRDKNDKAFLLGPKASIKPSDRTMWSKSMFHVPRRWELHVWQLGGPPSTWQAQLEQFFARQPVLAVLSGVGGNDWTPVHRFCERNAVACLFPNVDLPVDQPEDFYSLYFSGGLELEARQIAARIVADAADRHPVVSQVYRAGSTGEGAAAALATALAARGILVRTEAVASDSGARGLEDALRNAAAADALVLWLKPSDIAVLGAAPAQPRRIYLSGRLGGFEQMPLPGAWRSKSLVAFAVDLPERRRVRLEYALRWLSQRQVPITDLPVQADTWLACSLLTEALNELVDAFIPEYLIERIQDMLEHRLITGYYPHLALGEHQRFASKGGFVVRFAEDSGTKVVPVGDWFVP
ncbi:MAG TPA: cytochrome c, partial [Burkholderiaceae bacterium]